jgi:ribosomal-protein-alanine N-acetyltransferase
MATPETQNSLSNAHLRPVLEGERLVLRPHLEGDFDSVHEFSADADVCRYMQWGPNSEEQSRRFLASTLAAQCLTPKKQFDWVIVVKESGLVVGSFTLRLTDGAAFENAKMGEVGYVLSRAAWGKGFATEACDLAISYGFDVLGLHKVSATCEPLNFASAKVLQKAGLRAEGYLRKHILIKGEWHDTLIFGCVAEEREGNIKNLALKPKHLSIGDVTAVPLAQFPGVSQTPLSPAFGGGSLHHLFMRSGSKLGPVTNVMDEYFVVLNGSLESGGEILERGAVFHNPGAVRQDSHTAKSDVELLALRLGPVGERG